MRDLRDDGLKIHASGLAYVTLVTIVPLLAISFSVLKGIGLHNQVEPLIIGLLGPLGEQSGDIAKRIVAFVDNINVGVLGFVGFAMLVIAVLKMMRRIEAAFNEIWRVRRERLMAQRVRDYLGILFVGPLFMSLSVAMTEVLRNKSFIAGKIGVNVPEGLLSPAITAVPYALLILAFTALYMFMPNTQVKIAPAAIAGTMSAVMWKIMGKLFSSFVVGAGSYAAIYSVFATLMLLMVWIYLCWMIVLIGASVSYYIQNPSSQKVPRRFRAPTARVREKAALCVCSEVGRAFYAGEEPVTAYALATRVGVPSVILSDVLEMLEAAKILVATGKGFSAAYIPGCPFDGVTVGEMLARVRAVEEAGGVKIKDIKGPPALDTLLAAVDDAAGRELAKKTLKDIVGV